MLYSFKRAFMILGALPTLRNRDMEFSRCGLAKTVGEGGSVKGTGNEC